MAAVVSIAVVGARATSPSPTPNQSITFIAAFGVAPMALSEMEPRNDDSVEPSPGIPADVAPQPAPAEPQPMPERPDPGAMPSEPPDTPVAPGHAMPEETRVATAAGDRVDTIVGTFDRASAERPRPATALVRAAGFAAASAPVTRMAAGDAVRPAGFDRERAPRATVTMAQPRAAVVDTPVEVIFKPAANYTDEALALRIEGEVVLEVSFGASSDVSVTRVVRSLGHGLDEAAARAVLGIRFRPATSGGAPVDVSTLVHIEFRLT